MCAASSLYKQITQITVLLYISVFVGTCSALIKRGSMLIKNISIVFWPLMILHSVISFVVSSNNNEYHNKMYSTVSY